MKTPKFPKALRKTCGHPCVSCFGINRAEIARRGPSQHAPALAFGLLPLWDPDFDEQLLSEVSDWPLFRLTAELPRYLRKHNYGRELDLYDYGYVADLLRDALAVESKPRAVLCYSRALAWVEQAGKGALLNLDSLTRRT